LAQKAPTQQLARFLVSLSEAEFLAFANQLHDLVCDSLADAAEPEHLFGHAYAEFLTGERKLEPLGQAVVAARARLLREFVWNLALQMQAAFTLPLYRVGVPTICDGVIATARRQGQVNFG
jgi:hypothetical protein